MRITFFALLVSVSVTSACKCYPGNVCIPSETGGMKCVPIITSNSTIQRRHVALQIRSPEIIQHAGEPEILLTAPETSSKTLAEKFAELPNRFEQRILSGVKSYEQVRWEERELARMKGLYDAMGYYLEDLAALQPGEEPLSVVYREAISVQEERLVPLVDYLFENVARDPSTWKSGFDAIRMAPIDGINGPITTARNNLFGTVFKTNDIYMPPTDADLEEYFARHNVKPKPIPMSTEGDVAAETGEGQTGEVDKAAETGETDAANTELDHEGTLALDLESEASHEGSIAESVKDAYDHIDLSKALEELQSKGITSDAEIFDKLLKDVNYGPEYADAFKSLSGLLGR